MIIIYHSTKPNTLQILGHLHIFHVFKANIVLIDNSVHQHGLNSPITFGLISISALQFVI